jgi:hypothetical protein
MESWDTLFLAYCQPDCPQESSKAGAWLAERFPDYTAAQISGHIVSSAWATRRHEYDRKVAQHYLIAQVGDRVSLRMQSQAAFFGTSSRMLGKIGLALDSIPTESYLKPDGSMGQRIPEKKGRTATAMLQQLSAALARAQMVQRIALGYMDSTGTDSPEDILDNTFEVVLKKDETDGKFGILTAPVEQIKAEKEDGDAA